METICGVQAGNAKIMITKLLVGTMILVEICDYAGRAALSEDIKLSIIAVLWTKWMRLLYLVVTQMIMWRNRLKEMSMYMADKDMV